VKFVLRVVESCLKTTTVPEEFGDVARLDEDSEELRLERDLMKAIA